MVYEWSAKTGLQASSCNCVYEYSLLDLPILIDYITRCCCLYICTRQWANLMYARFTGVNHLLWSEACDYTIRTGLRC